MLKTRENSTSMHISTENRRFDKKLASAITLPYMNEQLYHRKDTVFFFALHSLQW